MNKTKKALTTALLAASIAIGSVPFTDTSSTGVLAASIQQANQVIAYAKSLEGIPYKSGGTTQKGFDASGYVQHVYQKFGVLLPRTSKDMFKAGTAIANPEPGDLVFYDTSNKTKKEANFVGIYLGKQQFIAVTTKNGVAIQSMDNSYWKTKYMGAQKAPLIVNEFAAETVKLGDIISDMKVTTISLTTKKALTRVAFEGQTTISGTVIINPKSANTYTLVPDESSLKKLPVIAGKKGNALLTFKNRTAASKILGNVKNKQKVTIILDNYAINVRNAKVSKEANLIKFVK